MKAKKFARILLIAVLLVAVCFLSYKITQKVRIRSEATPVAAGTSAVIQNENTSEVPTSALPEETTAELVTSADDALPEAQIIKMPEDDTWSTVLVNVYYAISEDYTPKLSEVIEGSGMFLDSRVTESFLKMYQAALSEGVTLTPLAGYMSRDREARLFDKKVEEYENQGYTLQKSQALAAKDVLPSGCSEHNFGLAIDIGVETESFKDTDAYKWLVSHASEYGFIERYTADKTDITHFNAQPWHWRYVGSAAAQAMKASAVCLEEYLGKIN